MIHRGVCWWVVALCLAAEVQADDLYRVRVTNQREAAMLRSTGVDGVVRLPDGFLVLADSTVASRLALTGLPAQLVMADVVRNELGFEIERGNRVAGQAATSDDRGGIGIVRLPKGPLRAGPAEAGLMVLADEHVEIEFLESRYTAEAMLARLAQASTPLDTLISRVSLDSLQSYERLLAGFYPRYPGTTTQNQARDWLAAKLASFGVDSVSVDSLGAVNQSGPLAGYNVVGYKFGHQFPRHYVVAGAHRDAAPDRNTGVIVPGADDNGSGTVAVLEMARVLANVETDITIVFALFDAEEEGLFGAKHCAGMARARGDSVVCMLNLDMIGDINNWGWARMYHGQQTGFANLFIALADSLLDLQCSDEGATISDNLPFDQAGYETAYLEEYNFSSVYHTVNDDTNHIGWDYLKTTTQASLAAIYAVNATAWPAPTLAFRFPYGPPSKISPARTTSFEVSISPVSGGVMVPGSGQLLYSIGDAPYVAVALTQFTSETFRATLPATECGMGIRYYIRAAEVTRGTITDMDTINGHFALSAGNTETVLADDFETDKGWVASGTSVQGMWARGFSAACGFYNDPIHDFDSSGQAYYTGNTFYYAYPFPVVSQSEAILTSPAIDLAGKSACVRYAVWYSNNASLYYPSYAIHQDTFKVYATGNGTDWTLVREIGPAEHADGGWYTYSDRLEDYVTPTADTRLKFVARDQGSRSIVEAAVDAFEVTAYDCNSLPSCCTGSTGNVNITGVIDLPDLSALVSYLVGGGYVLPCYDAANVNGYGIVDLVDLSALINYLTGGGYVLPNCP